MALVVALNSSSDDALSVANQVKQEESSNCELNGETPEFPAVTLAVTNQQLDNLDAEIARIDLERDDAFVAWWKNGVESYTTADKDLNADIDIDELYEYLMRTIRCDKAEAEQVLSKQRTLLDQSDSEVVVVLLSALSPPAPGCSTLSHSGIAKLYAAYAANMSIATPAVSFCAAAMAISVSCMTACFPTP